MRPENREPFDIPAGPHEADGDGPEAPRAGWRVEHGLYDAAVGGRHEIHELPSHQLVRGPSRQPLNRAGGVGDGMVAGEFDERIRSRKGESDKAVALGPQAR